MKKILGLDLGVTSIGWALIIEDDEGIPSQILDLGCRIVPYSGNEDDDFTKGTGESKCQQRTQKRTMRRGYDRYQLRRTYLKDFLEKRGMLPEKPLFNLNAVQLYELRDKALKQKISLNELGRILFHLNQKRGYKHMLSDESEDKKAKTYVQTVNNRYQEILEADITVGQYLYQNLLSDPHFRIKEKVFPRLAYIEEFNKIISKQKEYYPEVLSDEFTNDVRDKIIYFQRPLRSCKHLVNLCEFENKLYKNQSGKDVVAGPKVAPRTSPLFQICKIWESINNLKLKNWKGEDLEIPVEKKKELFEFLNVNEKLTLTDLYRILGITKKDGWYGGKLIGKGIQGNTTRAKLADSLQSIHNAERLLKFSLITTYDEYVDQTTGEIIPQISRDFEKEPLYQLWHLIYSVKERKDLLNILSEKFMITDAEALEKLSKIDFVKPGYGNKSSKAMRKILPFLMMGDMYSIACSKAGYNHSNSLTNDQNLSRTLKDKLDLLPKNTLRQPIVEKILNQMINLVNAIIEEYGKPDEIRVELARELKQSKDERNDTYLYNNKRERENKNIEALIQEYGLTPTRRRIEKFRLFHEIDGQDTRLIGTCLYCGQPFGIKQALAGDDVEVEHIIPRAILYDDSIGNKTLSHRKCNVNKGNRTAYDYMIETKSSIEFDQYLERVCKLYDDKLISKAKRDKLLTAGNNLPDGFIDRQLRETQYISRKSKDILNEICYHVTTTTGAVTEKVRKLWGWDDILMNLNLEKYRQANLTKIEEVERNGQLHKYEKIEGWSKRDDHRHHAIDALAVACTKQGFIQRLNSCTAKTTRDEMFAEIGSRRVESTDRLNLVENWLISRPHFTTLQVNKAIAGVLISFKAGKKVATFGKRKVHSHNKSVVVQDNIIVPRGALSEESVYGRIKSIKTYAPVKFIFEHPDLIVKDYIKDIVIKRLDEYNGNIKKALASLKNDPLYLDELKTIPLQYASVFDNEFVIRYPVNQLKEKDLKYVVDLKLKQILADRITRLGEKNAFKDLENDPVFLDPGRTIKVNSVRLFAKLAADKVTVFKKNELNQPIAWVKPGNNHHIAIYADKDGNLKEIVTTFWHAVERKKYGIPVIIKDSDAVWDKIALTEMPEEFIQALPGPGLTLKYSIQQNEMFLFPPDDKTLREIDTDNYELISDFLYRVQKISESYYVFRHHLDTSVNEDDNAFLIKRFLRFRSVKAFIQTDPIKVNISYLGKINLSK